MPKPHYLCNVEHVYPILRTRLELKFQELNEFLIKKLRGVLWEDKELGCRLKPATATKKTDGESLAAHGDTLEKKHLKSNTVALTSPPTPRRKVNLLEAPIIIADTYCIFLCSKMCLIPPPLPSSPQIPR